MGMKINAHLPIPADLKAEYPLSSQILKLKDKRDREIREIFEGKSDKFLVIVGPCSADNEDSVCEYVSKLATINEKVSDRLMIIPRIYTNKPRTTGEGYKGIFRSCEGNSSICGTEYLAGKLQSKFIRMYYEERSQESVI